MSLLSRLCRCLRACRSWPFRLAGWRLWRAAAGCRRPEPGIRREGRLQILRGFHLRDHHQRQNSGPKQSEHQSASPQFDRRSARPKQPPSTEKRQSLLPWLRAGRMGRQTPEKCPRNGLERFSGGTGRRRAGEASRAARIEPPQARPPSPRANRSAWTWGLPPAPRKPLNPKPCPNRSPPCATPCTSWARPPPNRLPASSPAPPAFSPCWKA